MKYISLLILLFLVSCDYKFDRDYAIHNLEPIDFGFRLFAIDYGRPTQHFLNEINDGNLSGIVFIEIDSAESIKNTFIIDDSTFHFRVDTVFNSSQYIYTKLQDLSSNEIFESSIIFNTDTISNIRPSVINRIESINYDQVNYITLDATQYFTDIIDSLIIYSPVLIQNRNFGDTISKGEDLQIKWKGGSRDTYVLIQSGDIIDSLNVYQKIGPLLNTTEYLIPKDSLENIKTDEMLVIAVVSIGYELRDLTIGTKICFAQASNHKISFIVKE